jgi:polyisoprenoid-binding protein YceI
MTRTALALPALLAATTLAATPVATAESWNVDRPHTEINFSVKHFFTPVTGAFEDFDIDLVYDPENPAASTVDVRIAVSSVNTGNERRDEHLRSADFFEAASHPHITFRSTSVRAAGENRLVARGPLTIKGVTREIELPITVLGIQDIPAEMQGMLDGVTRVVGFEAGTRVRRQDFGVGVGNWAATVVVGGDVDISIAVEANQK